MKVHNLCMYVYVSIYIYIYMEYLLLTLPSTNYWTLGYPRVHLAKVPKRYLHHHYHCQPIILYPIHPKKQCHSVLNLDHFSRTASYQAYVYTLKRYPRSKLRLYKFC